MVIKGERNADRHARGYHHPALGTLLLLFDLNWTAFALDGLSWQLGDITIERKSTFLGQMEL